MYLISRSARLNLPIRDRQIEYHPQTGAVLRIKPAISVQFEHAGSVPDYAKEAAQKLANWGAGIGHEEDPFTRCGSLDTEVEAERQGWSAEDRALVESVLKNGPSNGVEYVIAEKARAEKPWPSYDKIDGDEADAAFLISKKVVEDEWDPRFVLTYEAENANRPLVIAALEALVAEQDADVVGVISA